MSRSIHTTRRSLEEIVAQAAAKEKGADERLKEAWEEVTRKRILKQYVASERRGVEKPLDGTAVEFIPVEVLESDTNSKHGASEQDVRAILARLPDGAREGISRIQLSPVGFSEEPATLLPGVVCGNVLGSYARRSGLITIYGFAVDAKALVLPHPALSLYLRLSALKTLVHEIAHHHDRIARVRRGRWLADREENAEDYAARMEHEWTTGIVVPWLESTYAGEVASLLEWLEVQGGVPLPLAFFSHDPNLFLSGSYVFVRWIEEMASGLTRPASRLSFAQWIVYANRHQESLAITGSLLAADPDFLDARVLRAEVLGYMKRWDEAWAEAELILSSHPTCLKAWNTRGNVLEARKDWQGLLENSTRALACADSNPKEGRFAVVHRAIAFCALENEAEMASTQMEVEKLSPRRSPDDLRAMILRRAGRAQSR